MIRLFKPEPVHLITILPLHTEPQPNRVHPGNRWNGDGDIGPGFQVGGGKYMMRPGGTIGFWANNWVNQHPKKNEKYNPFIIIH